MEEKYELKKTRDPWMEYLSMGPSFMIAISIFLRDLPGAQWVGTKTASIHFENCDLRLAWLQAKTGLKVKLKMIQAADHVTFLRALMSRNSPRAEQSKKLFTASCGYCHYKNLPVSLLPSSNDQLWAHYRQPYSYSWRYGYQHKEVVLIMLGDSGFHPFKGRVSKRFTDSVCMEYACLLDVRIRQSLLRSVPLHDIIDFPMLTRQEKSTWAPTTHTWAVSRLSKHVYLLRLIRYRQIMTSYVGTRSHYHDSECND